MVTFHSGILWKVRPRVVSYPIASNNRPDKNAIATSFENDDAVTSFDELAVGNHVDHLLSKARFAGGE